MKNLFILLCFIVLTTSLVAQSGSSDIRKQLQNQFIMAESGDTIEIPAGNFSSKGTLSLEGKKNLVIRGQGIEKTILSFKGQTEGAEGINITNCSNIKVEGFTIQDAKGDGLKAKDTDGIYMVDMKVEWTGKPSSQNGAYGFYPVSCRNVLIEKCEAIGASDAGIYVGQSENIIVRYSRAYHNVAGIEIENSTQADVHNCEAYMNTGGILVFDLPDLPKKKGGQVRVYNNKVHENNFKNFAPKGNTVATVPPGTGVMILATSHVEVFNNEIQSNITAGTAIISYYMTQVPIKDELYYPYPTNIYIHDNSFMREKTAPTLKNPIGRLLFLKFKKNVPDILFDGITDKNTVQNDGTFKDEYRICIRNNGNATFANLDAENNFKNIQTDLTPFNCECKVVSFPDLRTSLK
ncbi:MAG: parallel beta-helix domain-containing protein [Bacteroidia bacterium]|nr:parallel beta-helix domain-containing protein [Bacteroidia bacterium]